MRRARSGARAGVRRSDAGTLCSMRTRGSVAGERMVRRNDALAALGLARQVAVTVPSFPAAMAVAMYSELVGLVTQSFVLAGRGGLPVHEFVLSVQTAPITVSQMWHPRVDADPAHRWLRETVLSVCRPRHSS